MPEQPIDTKPSSVKNKALEHVGESLVDQVKPEIWTALVSAVKSSYWPIYLHGPVGIGKSCAMRCVFDRWSGWKLWHEANAIVSDVITCRTNGKGYIVRTTPLHSWDEWEASILRKISDATLVCFDDVALREPSPAAYEIFYTMVNSRHGKATIFTGNLTPQQLRSTLDDRLASRILRGTVISASGTDRRLLQTKAVRA